jgi:hypothetical protein
MPAGLKTRDERAAEIREAVTQLRALNVYDAERFSAIRQFDHAAFAYVRDGIGATGWFPFEELDTRLLYTLPATAGRPAVVKLSKTGWAPSGVGSAAYSVGSAAYSIGSPK